MSASSGLNTVGSRLRVEVPVSSAPKSSAEKADADGVFRPSSATAMPMKPIVEVWTSLTASRNSHPSILQNYIVRHNQGKPEFVGKLP